MTREEIEQLASEMKDTEQLCDCKFKENCHYPRQYTQTRLRGRTGKSVEECDFYKMISDKLLAVMEGKVE